MAPLRSGAIAEGAGARTDTGELVPLDVKVADEVLFAKWFGTEVTIDGRDLLILKESDILGVVEASKVATKAA